MLKVPDTHLPNGYCNAPIFLNSVLKSTLEFRPRLERYPERRKVEHTLLYCRSIYPVWLALANHYAPFQKRFQKFRLYTKLNFDMAYYGLLNRRFESAPKMIESCL